MATRRATRLGLSIIAVLALCSPARGADRLTKSSTNPTALEIDQMVARDKGFFTRENIEIDVTYMTPDLVIKALLAGTVDLARSGAHFGLIAAARGGDLKIIGGLTYGYPYQVIGQPQFNSLRRPQGPKDRRRIHGQHHHDDIQGCYAAPGNSTDGLHPALRRGKSGKVSSRELRPGRGFPGGSPAV